MLGLTNSSKLGEEIGCKRYAEGTMIRTIEGLIESISRGIIRYIIGITESVSEGIKEGNLLGLKNNIIEGYIFWGTVGSLGENMKA